MSYGSAPLRSLRPGECFAEEWVTWESDKGISKHYWRIAVFCAESGGGVTVQYVDNGEQAVIPLSDIVRTVPAVPSP